jgi:uncharacterized protein (DUF433 family)
MLSIRSSVWTLLMRMVTRSADEDLEANYDENEMEQLQEGRQEQYDGLEWEEIEKR